MASSKCEISSSAANGSRTPIGLPSNAVSSLPLNLEWRKKDGDRVVQWETIGILKGATSATGKGEDSISADHAPPESPSAIYFIKAPVTGILQFAEKNLTYITKPEIILGVVQVEECSHLLVVGGLCANCCIAIRSPKVEKTSVSAGFLSRHKDLKVDHGLARSMEAERFLSLLNRRKLALILDLDNTLIHAHGELMPLSNERLIVVDDVHRDRPFNPWQATHRFVEEKPVNLEAGSNGKKAGVTVNEATAKTNGVVATSVVKSVDSPLLSNISDCRNSFTASSEGDCANDTENFEDITQKTDESNEDRSQANVVEHRNPTASYETQSISVDSKGCFSNFGWKCNTWDAVCFGSGVDGWAEGGLSSADMSNPSIETEAKTEHLKKLHPHYRCDAEALARCNVLESSVIFSRTADAASFYKLRPGVLQFLRRMSRFFELYLYTMGTDGHAKLSLRILDPERRFFGLRVFSRNDAIDGRKSVSRIFPSDLKMVLAIDDSEGMWKESICCIKAHAYFYHPDVSAADLRRLGPACFSHWIAASKPYCNYFKEVMASFSECNMKTHHRRRPSQPVKHNIWRLVSGSMADKSITKGDETQTNMSEAALEGRSVARESEELKNVDKDALLIQGNSEDLQALDNASKIIYGTNVGLYVLDDARNGNIEKDVDMGDKETDVDEYKGKLDLKTKSEVCQSTTSALGKQLNGFAVPEKLERMGKSPGTREQRCMEIVRAEGVSSKIKVDNNDDDKSSMKNDRRHSSEGTFGRCNSAFDEEVVGIGPLEPRFFECTKLVDADAQLPHMECMLRLVHVLYFRSVRRIVIHFERQFSGNKMEHIRVAKHRVVLVGDAADSTRCAPAGVEGDSTDEEETASMQSNDEEEYCNKIKVGCLNPTNSDEGRMAVRSKGSSTKRRQTKRSCIIIKEDANCPMSKMILENLPHISWILGAVRHSVLEGLKISISGTKGPHLPQFKHTDFGIQARTFGAKIMEQFNPSLCTHLICTRGTPNFHLAKTHKIPTVHIMWLEKAIYTWIRPNEAAYDFGLIDGRYRTCWEVPDGPLGAPSFDNFRDLLRQVDSELKLHLKRHIQRTYAMQREECVHRSNSEDLGDVQHRITVNTTSTCTDSNISKIKNSEESMEGDRDDWDAFWSEGFEKP